MKRAHLDHQRDRVSHLSPFTNWNKDGTDLIERKFLNLILRKLLTMKAF